ncbi:hypothetical protein BGW80DRAFT_1253044 [Lactifluus volemus]|nr:hypothetical protein BGW80DRAFT_1253044 [Lactifluus volemus]
MAVAAAAGDYARLKLEELRSKCWERRLCVSGNKTQLVQQLQDDDRRTRGDWGALGASLGAAQDQDTARCKTMPHHDVVNVPPPGSPPPPLVSTPSSTAVGKWGALGDAQCVALHCVLPPPQLVLPPPLISAPLVSPPPPLVSTPSSTATGEQSAPGTAQCVAPHRVVPPMQLVSMPCCDVANGLLPGLPLPPQLVSLPPPQLPSTPLTTAIGPLPPHPATALEGMVTDAEAGKVLDDAASVELAYQQAINNEGTMGWVDNFIFNTRRPSGQSTEASVIKLYNEWLPNALRDEVVPDEIIDANHTIQYLKYSSTRHLLTKQGEKKETDDCLSVQSLKKVVTMLARIRRRQEDDNPALVHTRPDRNS